jgi:hypothetical protein
MLNVEIFNRLGRLNEEQKESVIRVLVVAVQDLQKRVEDLENERNSRKTN